MPAARATLPGVPSRAVLRGTESRAAERASRQREQAGRAAHRLAGGHRPEEQQRAVAAPGGHGFADGRFLGTAGAAGSARLATGRGSRVIPPHHYPPPLRDRRAHRENFTGARWLSLAPRRGACPHTTYHGYAKSFAPVNRRYRVTDGRSENQALSGITIATYRA